MANRAYKGRRFEITLAAQLSLWWTNGKRDDVFWHTHDSGGRATRRARSGKTSAGHYGDICATDEEGAPFAKLLVVEAKSGYNRCTIHDLLDRPPGAAVQEYEKWVAQAEKSREAAGTWSWLLIHRRDRREALAVMPYDDYLRLRPGVSVQAVDRVYPGRGLPPLTILPLGMWVNVVDPKAVRRAYRKFTTGKLPGGG